MRVKSKDLKPAARPNPLFAAMSRERDLIKLARAGKLESSQWDSLAIQVLGLSLGALYGGIIASELPLFVKGILFCLGFVALMAFMFYQMRGLGWAAVGHFVVAYTVPLGLVFMLPWWPARFAIIVGSFALAAYASLSLGHRPTSKPTPAWRKRNIADREENSAASDEMPLRPYMRDYEVPHLADQDGDGLDDLGHQYRSGRTYRP